MFFTISVRPVVNWIMLFYCLAARLHREHFKEKKTVSNVPCKSILLYDRHGDHFFIDFPNSSISSPSARFACSPVLYDYTQATSPADFFPFSPGTCSQTKFKYTVELLHNGHRWGNSRKMAVMRRWDCNMASVFLRKMFIVTYQYVTQSKCIN